MSSFEDLASLFYVNLRIKLAVSRSYFIFRIWILTGIELNIFWVSARIGECWARSAGTLRWRVEEAIFASSAASLI